MSKRLVIIRILEAVALICVVCRFQMTEDYSKPGEARRVVGGTTGVTTQTTWGLDFGVNAKPFPSAAEPLDQHSVSSSGLSAGYVTRHVRWSETRYKLQSPQEPEDEKLFVGSSGSRGTSFSIGLNATCRILNRSSSDRVERRTVFISSLLVGYFLSLVGTLAVQKDRPKALWAISLILSALGFVCYGNEMVRYFVAGHDVSILFNSGIVLLIIDWAMLARLRKTAAPDESDLLPHSDNAEG
jgi:hypothetical protein